MGENDRAAQVLASSIQIPTTIDANRRSANFHPTVWGDNFLNYTTNSAVISLSEQVQVLKEEVRNMFASTIGNPKTKLELIEAIQRLGIAYHFESEIEESLENILKNKQDFDNEDDLHTVALLFRLLRQQCYNVSSNIFEKFKDDKNNFKEELVDDVKGMLSLYEASHLSVHGEDILDEALVFTTTNLQHKAKQVSPFLADQINHALKRPIRKALTRQEARYNIQVYQQNESHNEVVLRLAMLDFDLVQKLHQEELSSITKWWEDLDLARKLPYVRDRVVECYFWPLGVYFEPQYAFGRMFLTKAISIYSVIDDTYDVHGKIEELEIFTKAVERCDDSMMHKLPDYMKVCYQALLDLYSEIEEEMKKQGINYFKPYLKEATKNLVRAYLVEERWFNEGYIPTTEEYMRNGLTTSMYPLLTVVIFCGMGKNASKEAFEWVMTYPKMVKAASVIGRLMNDIASHKFEQIRGHVASAVECCINQHGISEQEAYNEINKLVSNAWKDINEELLEPTSVPVPLLTCILNLACVIDVVYKDEDGYTHSKVGLKNILSTLLLKPVSKT